MYSGRLLLNNFKCCKISSSVIFIFQKRAMFLQGALRICIPSDDLIHNHNRHHIRDVTSSEQEREREKYKSSYLVIAPLEKSFTT